MVYVSKSFSITVNRQTYDYGTVTWRGRGRKWSWPILMWMSAFAWRYWGIPLQSSTHISCWFTINHIHPLPVSLWWFFTLLNVTGSTADSILFVRFVYTHPFDTMTSWVTSRDLASRCSWFDSQHSCLGCWLSAQLFRMLTLSTVVQDADSQHSCSGCWLSAQLFGMLTLSTVVWDADSQHSCSGCWLVSSLSKFLVKILILIFRFSWKHTKCCVFEWNKNWTAAAHHVQTEQRLFTTSKLNSRCSPRPNWTAAVHHVQTEQRLFTTSKLNSGCSPRPDWTAAVPHVQTTHNYTTKMWAAFTTFKSTTLITAPCDQQHSPTKSI
jgi:hypothetical protein